MSRALTVGKDKTRKDSSLTFHPGFSLLSAKRFRLTVCDTVAPEAQGRHLILSLLRQGFLKLGCMKGGGDENTARLQLDRWEAQIEGCPRNMHSGAMEFHEFGLASSSLCFLLSLMLNQKRWQWHLPPTRDLLVMQLLAGLLLCPQGSTFDPWQLVEKVEPLLPRRCCL
jgi:hypothetical protein